MGRFHPLIVHLPIGFSTFRLDDVGLMISKENKHQKIIRFAFLWGTLSTLFAAILTGTGSIYSERVIRGRIFRDICFWGLLTFAFSSFIIFLKLKGYNRFLKKFVLSFSRIRIGS